MTYYKDWDIIYTMTKNFEQLQIVTPEYDDLAGKLGTVVDERLATFPNDIEYSNASLRLCLATDGMAPNSYYAVAKTLQRPLSDNPEVVPETEIQKIIDELSKSTPVHPDVEVAVPKASRNGTFIDGLLQNIPR